MNEPLIRFPVTCPQCGNEHLADLPVAEVAGALLQGRQLTLYAPCHAIRWSAGELELQQIREYLAWVDAPRE